VAEQFPPADLISQESPTVGCTAAMVELKIKITPGERVEFIGTRAQLEGEIDFPPGFEWPRAREWKHWIVGESKLSVFRTRPMGAKGAPSLWRDVDWWRLRVEPTGRVDYFELEVMLKEVELAKVRYRASAQGRAEGMACWKRCAVAKKDLAFQAFKAKIPELASQKVTGL